MSGVDLKEQGNRLFAARQYEDAIGCYSKAIVRFLYTRISSVCLCCDLGPSSLDLNFNEFYLLIIVICSVKNLDKPQSKSFH